MQFGIPETISKSQSNRRMMSIFFYKGLTRNLKIENTHLWVLPNIWKLGQDYDTKSCMNISNEMLLNSGKCQGYSFYRFRVIKIKVTGGKITSPPHPY